MVSYIWEFESLFVQIVDKVSQAHNNSPNKNHKYNLFEEDAQSEKSLEGVLDQEVENVSLGSEEDKQDLNFMPATVEYHNFLSSVSSN